MSVPLSRGAVLALVLAAVGASCVAQPASQPASRPAATAAVPLRAGLWETTVVTEIPATGSRRAVVSRTCVTPAETTNLARFIPQQREPGLQCENTDVKREGAAVVWQISCKAADTSRTGKGRLALFSESFLGSADMDTRKAGNKVVSKSGQSYSGKWLQPCG